jgi:CBS-domain-containing membrane protein
LVLAALALAGGCESGQFFLLCRVFLFVVSHVCHCLCFCCNFVVQFLTVMSLCSCSAPYPVSCVIIFFLFSSPLAKCRVVGGTKV